MIWNRVALWLKRVWVWIFAVLITLGIAFSRIYLGVHFISDVLGGLLFGVIFLGIFVLLEKPVIRVWKRISFPMQIGTGFLISWILIGIELLFNFGWDCRISGEGLQGWLEQRKHNEDNECFHDFT